MAKLPSMVGFVHGAPYVLHGESWVRICLEYQRHNTPKTCSIPPVSTKNIIILQTSLQRESLLDHPVVTTFLHHKWVSVGRYAFISSLVIYLLFLFMLTGFIIVMPPSYYVQSFNHTLENPDRITWNADGKQRWVDSASHFNVLIFNRFGYIVIIALSVLNLFREVEKYNMWYLCLFIPFWLLNCHLPSSSSFLLHAHISFFLHAYLLLSLTLMHFSTMSTASTMPLL